MLAPLSVVVNYWTTSVCRRITVSVLSYVRGVWGRVIIRVTWCGGKVSTHIPREVTSRHSRHLMSSEVLTWERVNFYFICVENDLRVYIWSTFTSMRPTPLLPLWPYRLRSRRWLFDTLGRLSELETRNVRGSRFRSLTWVILYTQGLNRLIVTGPLNIVLGVF